MIHLLVTGIVNGRETRPVALCGSPSREMTFLLERVTCQRCLKKQKRIEKERMGGGTGQSEGEGR